MHPSEGEIRAFQDQELSAEARRRVATHLASCLRCQEKAQALLDKTQRVNEHLSSLGPAANYSLTSAKSAHTRFEARLLQLEEKENQNMWNKLSSRISRPVWVTLVIVVVLAVSLAFPPVRAVANSFLKLFRVEQIRVVQVDTEKLPGQLESSSHLEQLFSEKVQVEEGEEPQKVSSVEEASELAGIPVILPTTLDAPQEIWVQPGGSVTFQIDLELVRAVLKDIERSDIELPDSLDGATVRLEFQGGVLAQYGDCTIPAETATGDPDDPDNPPANRLEECITLLQAPSPTVSAPPDLDINSLGEAYLQLLGMSREEAASFARNVDWTTTFVMPLPRYGADYQDVQVNGVTGTLFENWGYNWKMFTILWVKDGIFYALSTPGGMENTLQIANSLK